MLQAEGDILATAAAVGPMRPTTRAKAPNGSSGSWRATQAAFPIATMARVPGVPVPGHHAWRRRRASVHATSDAALRRRVRTIHAASHGTLACELMDRCGFSSRAEARMAVFALNEGVCDPTRRHSALSYLPPTEDEARAMSKSN